METRFEPFLCLRWNLIAALLLLPGALTAAGAKDKADYAREFRAQLAQKVMPYWLETIDTQHGGYLLADDVKGKGTATEKQIVTQARMIWGFSTAHESGLSDAQHNYLKAAENGYHFMLDHFLDRQYGGYYWRTDLAGKPLNERKLLYGESFVVYAFVEYYRASGDKDALRRAMDLYRLLQEKCHDHERGGLYSRGFDDRPATDTEKVWWVQAEMLAALADGLRHEPKNAAYSGAVDQELHWLMTYQINPPDGIWLESVNADGMPKSTGKAHSWKGAYHDVRGIVKFIDAFGRR